MVEKRLKRWNATDRLDQVRTGNVNIPRMHILGSRVAHLLFDNPAWHPSHEGISHECVPEIMDAQSLVPALRQAPRHAVFGTVLYGTPSPVRKTVPSVTVADHRSKYRDKLVVDGYTP